MTTRVKALTVVLEQDYREDDVEEIANAIKQLRGVAGVTNVDADFEDHINRIQIRGELLKKIIDIFNPPKTKTH